MEIEIDFSDLLRFADHLDLKLGSLSGLVRPVVAKGAVKVKATMRADMNSSEHFGQAASSISYDLNSGQYGAEAQIGPVKGGAGSLANLAYFGGANGGGGTVRDPQEALDLEADPFEQALGDILDNLL